MKLKRVKLSFSQGPRSFAKKNSLSCKVNFFPQNFLLYFEKGNFGGKKLTLQKTEFTLQRSFFLFQAIKFNK
jgi:hypothetical protein